MLVYSNIMASDTDNFNILNKEQSDLQFQQLVYNHIGKYTKQSWIYSTYEMIVTLILLYVCLSSRSFLMVPVFAMVFIRTFIIFHDLGHYSFFPSKNINWLFGLVLGAVTFTPFSYWVEGHTYHHKNANKINKEQHAQTAAWDTERYINASYFSKFVYKLMYGKYTLFTINPVVYFMVLNRFKAKKEEVVVQFAYVLFLIAYLNSDQYIYFISSVWLGAIIGFMIFHAQHTFNGGYRAFDETDENIGDNEKWSYFKNGMYGSSFIQLPFFLKLFTCNIQYHHIHHLNSNVPLYRLKQCHDEGLQYFKNVPKIYIRDIISSLKYSVYNVKKCSYEDVYKL